MSEKYILDMNNNSILLTNTVTKYIYFQIFVIILIEEFNHVLVTMSIVVDVWSSSMYVL